MGVLDGRRLKFTPGSRKVDGEHVVDRSWYEVAAVSTTRVHAPHWITLGRVVRDTRSTDSRIAGTRMRRPGKGAVVWRAEVPREQWGRGAGGLPRGCLQGDATPGAFRLEWRGESWDRREDAAMALVAWYEQREGGSG